jgi:thiosulfate dehydrogenase
MTKESIVDHSKYQIAFAVLGLVALVSAVVVGAASGVANEDQPVDTGDGVSVDADSAEPVPEGALGDVIRLGRQLVETTADHPMTRPYSGNSLNCTSCHLDNGTHETAGTFIGVATAYPAWSPRERRVITLEDRVLNCFMRSCNGVRPPLGSEPSVAITAYITWLSTAQPIRMNGASPLGPLAIRPLDLSGIEADESIGESLYVHRCASCHGDDGAGDDTNPPVWGDRSYNQGAGLANNAKLASWLKVSMPLDDADLTIEESLHIAAFINSKPRPAFRLEDHLPPADAMGRYNSESRQ